MVGTSLQERAAPPCRPSPVFGPRTTTVTLPLKPDVVFKVGCSPLILTLPLLQVQSGGLFAGGYAWVSDAPGNKPNTAYFTHPAALDPCPLVVGSRVCLANMGFSSFEQSASCYIPLWRPASWQIVPPVVTLEVDFAVHQRCKIPGWMPAVSSFFFGRCPSRADYSRTATAVGSCSSLAVALIATRLFGRYSTDTQQVLNLIEMMFPGMAFTGTLTMFHLALHAVGGGITGELTVLGILSYHESLLLEATAAALACALCIFVVGTSPASTPAARTARRGRTSTQDSGLPDSPSQERIASKYTTSDPQMCRHCGALPCRHIDVVERPKLPLPGRWQEALPTRLKEALLKFLIWKDTAVGFQTILFVNFSTTLCVLVSYNCLHGASIGNRSQLMLALYACSFAGCLVTLLCAIGFATDRHARKALAVKSVLIPLKIWFLIILGSFELTHDKVAVEVPSWRTWQCVAGSCPHMCKELPNGHCLFNQVEDVTTCTCEFLGIPHSTFSCVLTALIASSCWLVVGSSWKGMRKLHSDGRLSRAGFSPFRITVPLLLANICVAYTCFWLSLVSDTVRFGCFDTSSVRDAIGITVPILPLAVLINELECFLDNVRDGHRYRTVATSGGVSVLKWIAASTCAVCGLLSSGAALKSALDTSKATHCTAGLAVNYALLYAVALGLFAMPCGLAALRPAPLAGLSPDAFDGVVAHDAIETLERSRVELHHVHDCF